MNPLPPSYPPITGERREPGLVLLFGFITCGIYYLYWLYMVSEEMQRFDGEPDTPPGMELLLSIVTCGLYTIYWDYKAGQKVARLQAKVGLPPSDNSILYLVLNIVQLGFVPSMIIQGHLNEIWSRANQLYGGSYSGQI